MRTALKAAVLLVSAVTLGVSAGGGDRSDAKPKHPADTYPFAKGIIAKLDLPAQRLTLQTEQGSRAFELTPRTYIFRGKEKLTPDKLKIGDSIKLNYHTNDLGHALIRRIKIDQPETPD
jgi:Cu/Ag efflux protein CusF